jgi:hypothetical protein
LLAKPSSRVREVKNLLHRFALLLDAFCTVVLAQAGAQNPALLNPNYPIRLPDMTMRANIRKVDTSGVISSLLPNGISLFGPYIFETGADMAIDSADNIYFSDGLTVIWKLDSSGNATIAAGV